MLHDASDRFTGTRGALHKDLTLLLGRESVEIVGLYSNSAGETVVRMKLTADQDAVVAEVRPGILLVALVPLVANPLCLLAFILGTVLIIVIGVLFQLKANFLQDIANREAQFMSTSSFYGSRCRENCNGSGTTLGSLLLSVLLLTLHTLLN